MFGMAGATALLVIFAGSTMRLLRLVGLLFAGGVLLLWVCWKMWRELRATANQEEEEAVEVLTGLDINADGTVTGYAPRTTLAQAAGQIIIADLSMSLDNVLTGAPKVAFLLEEIVFCPTKWRSGGPPHNPSIRRFVSPTLGASMRRNVNEIAEDDVDASPECACCFP
jgi:hypothetical protein